MKKNVSCFLFHPYGRRPWVPWDAVHFLFPRSTYFVKMIFDFVLIWVSIVS
jgi:hypothetical protein